MNPLRSRRNRFAHMEVNVKKERLTQSVLVIVGLFNLYGSAAQLALGAEKRDRADVSELLHSGAEFRYIGKSWHSSMLSLDAEKWCFRQNSRPSNTRCVRRASVQIAISLLKTPGFARPSLFVKELRNWRGPMSVAELPVSVAIICEGSKISCLSNRMPSRVDLNLSP